MMVRGAYVLAMLMLGLALSTYAAAEPFKMSIRGASLGDTIAEPKTVTFVCSFRPDAHGYSMIIGPDGRLQHIEGLELVVGDRQISAYEPDELSDVLGEDWESVEGPYEKTLWFPRDRSVYVLHSPARKEGLGQSFPYLTIGVWPPMGDWPELTK